MKTKAISEIAISFDLEIFIAELPEKSENYIEEIMARNKRSDHEYCEKLTTSSKCFEGKRKYLCRLKST